MDTPLTSVPASSATPADNRVYDGFYRKPNKKTKMATFRIYEVDFIRLKTDYDGNMGLVIRTLVEEFFKGSIPSVETIIKQQLAPIPNTLEEMENPQE